MNVTSATLFEPIADPLGLAERDPAGFVAEVRRRGMTLARDRSECSPVRCARLMLPSGPGYPHVLRQSCVATAAVNAGFDGRVNMQPSDSTSRRYHAVGRSIAAAAGMGNREAASANPNHHPYDC